MSFAPLAFKLFYAARQNAVLRRSPFMGRAWKGQFEGRGTRLLYLDDESYASDEAKPLPE